MSPMERAIYYKTLGRNHGIRLTRTIDKLNQWNTSYELALIPGIRALPQLKMYKETRGVVRGYLC